MRKIQKSQAEDFIMLLKEAHGEIKKAVVQNEYDLVLELLGQCQDGAIKLGEMIESAEGEGFPTISLLEGYCEQVYRIYEQVNQKENVDAHRIFQALRMELAPIEESVRDDIKIRKEAVFLPYKASMWDSLESVWKAANDDPNCDTYVIPIPYYDKNPDGSFRQMHYEADQYPDYVPITKYDAFDFGMHRPDMIFIHNPYDSSNFVTSVHPFFFSENLRKFTEKLVYIPYFILDEIKPDDDAAIEGMEHFCITPGVFNADKVVVQSEDMKQIYMKVLMGATDDHSEATKKYWDNKILGLGSPKIDKVLNTKKENLEVPQEWLKVIEKPDGSWKKIIFYNTSVVALLHHNEKMLEKMRYVFQVFQENKEEVALLWRPHPLIKATIESMRPQLWGKYDKLVREYQEEGWGIYDDSADVDRAIALSDAYYGDASSVVQMYHQTGKPSEIQNVDVRKKSIENSRNILVYGAYTDGISCWLPARELNALFYMDLSKRHIKYIDLFRNDDNEKAQNIIKVIAFEKEFFFFQRYAYTVWILNTCTNKMEKCVYGRNTVILTNVERVADEAWIFSDSFNEPIVCFDLKNKKCTILNWEPEKYKDSDTVSFTRLVEDCGKFYLSTRKKDEINVCIIDYIKRKVSYRHIETLCYINCLEVNGNKIWLCGKNCYGKTVLQVYNLEKWGMEEEAELSELEMEELATVKYFRMILFENKIFFIPSIARKFVVYDVLTGTEKVLQYPDNFCYPKDENDKNIFTQIERVGEKIYLYPSLAEQILILDMRKLVFEAVDVVCEKTEYDKAYKNLFTKCKMPLYESGKIGIDTLIMAVKRNKVEDELQKFQGECGNSIYNALLS